MGAAVIVENGPSIRSSFRNVGGKDALARLKEAYVPIAEMAANAAQGHARAGSKLQRAMAGAIKPFVRTTSAGVRVSATRAYPAAKVAFWGVDRRLGWFAAPKFHQYSSVDQHLPVNVGHTWLAGVRGQGPYAVNDGVADAADFAERHLEDAIMKAAADVGLL